MAEFEKAFVAYASHDSGIAEMVLEAVRVANAKSSAVRYEPWEFNDVPGNPIISPILEGIQSSSFIVADITHLNPNVVYEIGFTIGSRKRAFLVRHKPTVGDLGIANQIGIFDTLGFYEYTDKEDLTHRLVSHIDPAALPFSITSDPKAPVYIVEPPVKEDAATLMTSRLKKARYRYRSFSPSEDSRLSASDAIRQVSASAGVLVALYDDSEEWARVHNIRALFVAGLTVAMEKPLLILCPESFQAPLDVRDAVKRYREPPEIVKFIAEFVLEVTDYSQLADPAPVQLRTSLQVLDIGEPTAENEMTTLGNYYLPVDQFGRTLQGAANLVVGRKGSGKTALFIQVRDKIRSDKRNVVIDLKPEGYQLIRLKEDILSYLSGGSRQHLITAFWEYLLLLEVAYKLLEKDKVVHRYNHNITELYRDLEKTYKRENFSSEGDFSERLLVLSNQISSGYKTRYGTESGNKLSNDQVARLLYAHDIRDLREKISKYVEQKQQVWVLFDNLDKGWSTKGVDEIDAIVLRCLVDAGRKVERDMRKEGHRFHCVVFVRNDVYEYLMQHSSDYGKEMRAVMDWTDPDQLREMLRLRLVSGLGAPETTPFEKIWREVCVSHYRGEETSSFIIDRSLMRPRNVLKLFSYSRGFANNFSRQAISEDDIEKGLNVYSQDLLVELSHELVDVFPGARDLLYYFLDAKQVLTVEDLQKFLLNAGVDENDFGLVIDFLLYYGIIGLRTEQGDQYIFNVNYDPKVLQIRAELAGADGKFVINPAFCPALGIPIQH
jgi:hypothetical protein